MTGHDNDSFDFGSLRGRLGRALSEHEPEPMANGRVNAISPTSDAALLRRASTAILLLHTPQCPYCGRMMVILGTLAAAYASNVYFASINVGEFPSAADRYGVRGVPVLVALKRGHVIGRVDGLVDQDDLDAWIDAIRRGLRPMSLRRGPMTIE